MNTFLIADTHLNHASIMRHCRNRPWLRPGDIGPNGYWVSPEIREQRVQEMNEGLIDNWNRTVSRKDITIIDGDFAWKEHPKFIQRLNGKKILIIGSHDHMPQESLQQFSEVHQLLMRKIHKQPFFIFHWPCQTWQGIYYGTIHVHGHCHGRLPKREGVRMIDVGVDTEKSGFCPINVDSIIEDMLKIPLRRNYEQPDEDED